METCSPNTWKIYKYTLLLLLLNLDSLAFVLEDVGNITGTVRLSKQCYGAEGLGLVFWKSYNVILHPRDQRTTPCVWCQLLTRRVWRSTWNVAMWMNKWTDKERKGGREDPVLIRWVHFEKLKWITRTYGNISQRDSLIFICTGRENADLFAENHMHKNYPGSLGSRFTAQCH